MTSDIRKQATLVKTVFGGDKGKELLDILESNNKVSFTPDVNDQYRRIGRNELIEEIKYLLSASASDLKKMESADSYDNYEDF